MSHQEHYFGKTVARVPLGDPAVCQL